MFSILNTLHKNLIGMNNFQNSLLLILILFAFKFYGQDQIDYKKFEGFSVQTTKYLILNNVFFKEYGNERFDKFEDRYLRKKQISDRTPENLLISYYSLTSKSEIKKITKSNKVDFSKGELERRSSSDSLMKPIRFFHRLTFDYQKTPITFFKYRFIKDSIPSKPKILVMKKEGQQWMIYDDHSFENISFAIQHLKTFAFWEFFNLQDNPDYPELNKFKSIVQDSNGILNIEKLSKVIKENQSVLNKYLDN